MYGAPAALFLLGLFSCNSHVVSDKSLEVIVEKPSVVVVGDDGRLKSERVERKSREDQPSKKDNVSVNNNDLEEDEFSFEAPSKSRSKIKRKRLRKKEFSRAAKNNKPPVASTARQSTGADESGGDDSDEGQDSGPESSKERKTGDVNEESSTVRHDKTKKSQRNRNGKGVTSEASIILLNFLY